MKLAICKKYKNKWTDDQLKKSGKVFENTECSLEELSEFINQGYSFCSQHDGWRSGKNYLESNILAVDIDNGLTIEQAISNPFVQTFCGILYTTPSHTDDDHRFRLVFESERLIVSAQEMRYALSGLIRKFGGDKKCQDACRLFFGSENSNPQVYGHTLPSLILDQVISLGKELVQDKNNAIANKVTKGFTQQSNISIDLTTTITDSEGMVYSLAEVPLKTRIHCPVHIDTNPSAFVLENKSGVKGVHCSKCNATYFTSSKLAMYEFDYDWENVTGIRKDVLGKINGDLYRPEEMGSFVRINEKYLPPIVTHSPVVIIKSPKGSGKTHYLESVIREARSKKQSVLLIGHRRSLIASISERLGLVSYYQPPVIDMKCQIVRESKMVKPNEYYAICVDSMTNLLEPPHDKYDVVIIDEVEQVFSHMTSSTLNKRNLRNNTYQFFKNYVSQASKVYVLDADVSYLTVNTLKKYLSEKNNKDVVIILNQYKSEGKVIDIYSNLNHLIADIHLSIGNDELCFICSNSKKKVRYISKTISDRYPEKKILEITSENSQDTEIQDFIRNIKTQIVKFDAIIVSPSLGTGVDITFDDNMDIIDNVYGVFEGNINTHFDIDQQISRVRHPKRIAVWLSPREFRYETHEQSITNEINESEKYNRRIIGIDSDGNIHYEDYNQGYIEIYCDVMSARRGSINHLKKQYIEMKEKQGWVVNHIESDDSKKKTGKGFIDNAKELVEEDRINSIVNALLITDTDYDAMKIAEDRLSLLPVHTNAMRRFEIESFYYEEITRDLITFDADGNRRYQIRNYEEFVGNDRDLARLDYVEGNVGKHTVDKKERIQKKDFFLKIFSSLDLLDDEDNIIPDKYISGDQAEEAIKYIKQKEVSLQRWFNISLRADIDSKPIQQLGVILKVLGIEWTKKSKKRKDRGKTYLYAVPGTLLTRVNDIVDRRKDENNWSNWCEVRRSVQNNRLLIGGHSSVLDEIKSQIRSSDDIGKGEFRSNYDETDYLTFRQRFSK